LLPKLLPPSRRDPEIDDGRRNLRQRAKAELKPAQGDTNDVLAVPTLLPVCTSA